MVLLGLILVLQTYVQNNFPGLSKITVGNHGKAEQKLDFDI